MTDTQFNLLDFHSYVRQDNSNIWKVNAFVDGHMSENDYACIEEDEDESFHVKSVSSSRRSDYSFLRNEAEHMCKILNRNRSNI